MIIEINPDIKELVDQCGGYCPCAIEHNEDTLCPCKEFREQESGECHCGRFLKDKPSENEEFIERLEESFDFR